MSTCFGGPEGLLGGDAPLVLLPCNFRFRGRVARIIAGVQDFSETAGARSVGSISLLPLSGTELGHPDRLMWAASLGTVDLGLRHLFERATLPLNSGQTRLDRLAAAMDIVHRMHFAHSEATVRRSPRQTIQRIGDHLARQQEG